MPPVFSPLRSSRQPSPWSRILESAHDGHFVQFYGSDEGALTRNVTKYFRDGVDSGEPGLIIATQVHLASFEKTLGHGVIFLDARETLARFMVFGHPDWERFQDVIDAALHTLRESAPGATIRAFGEMVGILWAAGQFAAAIRLEQFWNRLLNRDGVNLYCAYPIDILSSGFHSKNVDALLSNHTHILPGIDGGFESFIFEAMHDILGGDSARIRAATSNPKASWGLMPPSEALLLALRDHAPHQADEIVSIARARYANDVID
jgi:hypothetical protein